MGQGDEGWEPGQEGGLKSVIRARGRNMKGTVGSENREVGKDKLCQSLERALPPHCFLSTFIRARGPQY